jgi:hypothetical protein
MGVEVVTQEDLEKFRMRLLDDLKNWAVQFSGSGNESMEGLRTRHVRQILNCSTGKLHLLRNAGKLRCKKIGGTVYYRKEDVKKLIEEGFK